jgi:hypothetical protein
LQRGLRDAQQSCPVDAAIRADVTRLDDCEAAVLIVPNRFAEGDPGPNGCDGSKGSFHDSSGFR